VLSRVADNLYWMRRYVERADHIARVIGVNLDLAFDRAPDDVARLWGRLLSALWAAPEWSRIDREGASDALADLTGIDDVAACVAVARENARQVRQHISGEMWERLNRLHLVLGNPARRAAWAERPHEFFQVVREGAALFHAAVNTGAVRDEAWHFMQLGLFLERAAGTARLLACQMREADPAVETGDGLDAQLEWTCLLSACDGLELYGRRCGAELKPDRILRFLIADPLSPRSVRYALDEVARALEALAVATPNKPPIITPLATAPTAELMYSAGSDPNATMAAIEAECDRIHRCVYATYIDHSQPDVVTV
jgi:uncharacterized alpha-E superfamily protein